jgi:hypothetical protein
MQVLCPGNGTDLPSFFLVFTLLGIKTLHLNLKDLKAMDRKEIIRNNNCCEGKRQQIILHIANLTSFP